MRELAGKLSAPKIARQLHRSAASVRTRANILGLSLFLESWSQHAVATLFGLSSSAVNHSWIATGLLRARTVVYSGRYERYTIAENDLERFITDYPWAYDVTRMTPRVHPLVRLAERSQRRDPWLTVDEAAERLRCRPRTLERYRKLGLIPYKRRAGGYGDRGGQIVMRECDVDAAAPRIFELRLAAHGTIALNKTHRRQERAA